MSERRRHTDFLADILEAIDRILTFTSDQYDLPDLKPQIENLLSSSSE